MYGFDLDVDNLPEMLRAAAGIDDLVLDEMERTMRRSLDVLEAAVVQRTPVASGATRQGWGTRIERGLRLVRGILANPVQHAVFAERGRKPGKMPPLDPIELWVRRVLNVSPDRSRQVAFLVARAIGRRGTKGARMAERGLEASRGTIVGDFADIPDRVAHRFIHE